VKSLINAGLDEKNSMDGACLREAYGTPGAFLMFNEILNLAVHSTAQAGRFASGTPAQQFQRIATKEIKHKL